MDGFVISIDPKGWRLREERKGKGLTESGVMGFVPGADPMEMEKG